MMIVVKVLIIAGVFFFTTATIGLLRFPDFYTRMHATGKGDSLGSLLTLAGLAIYHLSQDITFDSVLVSVKIMFIALFIFIANPTATHAIARTGLDCSVKPWEKGGNAK